MVDTVEHEHRLDDSAPTDPADTRNPPDFASLSTEVEDLRSDVEDLRTEVADFGETVAELDAATQALRGYVGAVEHVNDEVERRADAALAAVDRLERRVDVPGPGDLAGAADPLDDPPVDADVRSSHADERPARDDERPERLLDRLRSRL